MQISQRDWNNYIKKLTALDNKAAELIKEWVDENGLGDRDALIAYTFDVVQTFSAGSASLAADWYEAVAELEGIIIPNAELAELPTYGDVAKTINGTMKRSLNTNLISSAAAGLVKRTGADTTLKNAKRDGAQFAWIPSGDTCVYCMQLASYGWRYATEKTAKGDHAEHIHANCDCEFGIRFGDDLKYSSYDPDKYKEIFDNAEGDSIDEKRNSIRRMQYQDPAKRDKILSQKRALRELAQKDGKKKVLISDIAIEKVKAIGPNGAPVDQLKELNKKILTASQKENNSNEVAMTLIKGVFSNPVFGDEKGVNILSDTATYHVLRSSDTRSVTLSHNHPSLSYFSMDDIGIFVQFPSISTIEVVTNAGKTWYLHKTPKFDDYSMIGLYHRVLEENVGEKQEKLVEIFLKMSDNTIERNR